MLLLIEIMSKLLKNANLIDLIIFSKIDLIIIEHMTSWYIESILGYGVWLNKSQLIKCATFIRSTSMNKLRDKLGRECWSKKNYSTSWRIHSCKIYGSKNNPRYRSYIRSHIYHTSFVYLRLQSWINLESFILQKFNKLSRAHGTTIMSYKISHFSHKTRFVYIWVKYMRDSVFDK